MTPGASSATPSPFTNDDARAYIAMVRWQFAKTMPQWPHEYTVRDWRQDLDGDFREFVSLIREAGIVKPWPRDATVPRYHHTYLELDGWEYWSMGEPVPETTVINRARADTPATGVGSMAIDTAFDFRADATGPDPDSSSPTLRRYHQLLWSKPLPGGASFDLSATTPGQYLYHHSDLGEFKLTSDAVMATLTRRPAVLRYIEQLADDEIERFATIAYTIGAMMVFPGNQIDRRQTINQARGCHGSICDRFDLTLECIRRHYLGWNDPDGAAGSKNPLGPTLALYADFFTLFDDFDGYVRFFLLDDLVVGGAVRFFAPFDDFRWPAVPQDVHTYRDYSRRSIEFIEARNRQIESAPETALFGNGADR